MRLCVVGCALLAVMRQGQLDKVIALLRALVDNQDAVLSSLQRPVAEESIPVDPEYQRCDIVRDGVCVCERGGVWIRECVCGRLCVHAIP